MAWLKAIADLIRVLVSEDGRKAAEPVLQNFRRSTSDLSSADEFYAEITRAERSRTLDVEKRFVAELAEKGIPSETLSRFRLCFSELAQNALDHGCRFDQDTVRFDLRIGEATTELAVRQRKALPKEIRALRHKPTHSWLDETRRITGAGGLLNVLANSNGMRIVDERSLVVVIENTPRLTVEASHTTRVNADLLSARDPSVLNLTGQIDAQNSAEVAMSLEAHLGCNLVINLTDVDVLTSSGLRVLINFGDKNRNQNNFTILCCPPGFVRSVLDAVNLQRLFPVADTLTDSFQILEELASSPRFSGS